MQEEFGPIEPGEYANELLAQVRQKIFGLDEEIRLALAAYFCGRHVLLEGNPGLGKTALVKTLSSVLNLGYRRIQFTPDLMPTDITGTSMPDLEEGIGGRWRFQPGPIFANLLLADEINRATPKTQSAMLEAMEERQVTVQNQTHFLPDDSKVRNEYAPFMVLATQNPIDHEGVYNLPEAQADRFMFKLIVHMPGHKHLLSILNQETGSRRDESGQSVSSMSETHRVSADDQERKRKRSLECYKQVRRQILEVDDLEELSGHISNLVMASNGMNDQMHKPVKNKENQRRLESLVNLLQFGLGPRAAINLLLGAKALKLLFPGTPADGDEKNMPQSSAPGATQLAQALVPTLRHRLHMRYDWEEDQSFLGLPHTDARIQAYICQLAYLTAPDVALYRTRLKAELSKIEPSIRNLP